MDREAWNFRRNVVAAGVTAVFVGALAYAHYTLPPLPEKSEAVLQQKQADACATVQKAKAELVAKGLASQAEALNVDEICNPGSTMSFARKLVLSILGMFLAVALFCGITIADIVNRPSMPRATTGTDEEEKALEGGK